MTLQSKKIQERHYAEMAAKLMGQTWALEGDREHPDFIVTDSANRFGLELASLFVGAKGRSEQG